MSVEREPCQCPSHPPCLVPHPQLSFLALKAIADLSEGPENLKAARLALFADRTGKAWEQVRRLRGPFGSQA